jgi:HSP20 family protein
MITEQTKSLQAKPKKEVSTATEHVSSGPTFTPAVDIFETETDITVLADMPGVKPEKVSIDLRDNVLTLAGEAESPERAGEADVLREYHTGSYFRQFTLSEVIDQARIEAKLKDGVLRLVLPKVAAATPKKITVKAV